MMTSVIGIFHLLERLEVLEVHQGWSVLMEDCFLVKSTLAHTWA